MCNSFPITFTANLSSDDMHSIPRSLDFLSYTFDMDNMTSNNVMYKTTNNSYLWVGLTMLLVPVDSSFVIDRNWWKDVQYG